MNLVVLTGRLVKNIEITYSSGQMAVGKVTIAVDRGKRDGKELGCDFIPIKAFGKTAETIEMYCEKGNKITITGRMQVNNYETQEGEKKTYTEVIVDKLEIHEFKKKKEEKQDEAVPEFSAIEEDIPF